MTEKTGKETREGGLGEVRMHVCMIPVGLSWRACVPFTRRVAPWPGPGTDLRACGSISVLPVRDRWDTPRDAGGGGGGGWKVTAESCLASVRVPWVCGMTVMRVQSLSTSASGTTTRQTIHTTMTIV